MYHFNIGESKPVWAHIYERSRQENVTVANQTFLVKDTAGNIVQTSDTASLENNGTTDVYIYGEVDTTTGSWPSGSYYDVYFSYTISGYPHKTIVRFYYGDKPIT